MGNIVKYGELDYNPKWSSVYFKRVDFSDLENNKLPEKGNIILKDVNGNNPDVEISASSFENNKNTNGWYVNDNNENIQVLIKDNKKPTSKLNVGEYWLNNNKYWLKGGQPYKKVFGAIMKSIEKMYNGTNLGVGHKWGPNPSDPHKEPMVGVLDFEVATNSKHWSIVNLFNSNPEVRRILLREYGNYLGSGVWSLDDFVKHIFDNREKFFHPNSSVFKELAKANHRTWGNYGVNNEKAAKEYLESYYGGGYTVYGKAEPGLRADVRDGVDLKVINKNGKEDNYQAKPLDSWSVDSDGKWVIKSNSDLKYYNPNKVGWFIFGPNKNSGGENKKGEFLIFKNEGQHPIDTVTIAFNYKPENFTTDDDYDFSSKDVFPWTINNVVDDFIDTGKIPTEQNIYQTQIGVGTEKVSFDQVYQMFYPFERLTSNYPELREYREIIKKKCLKSADGNVEKAKDYCSEVFLQDIGLFFRKGYHFPNMDKLIGSVISKVGTGLIDLHRKRKTQKRNPTDTKRMDDKYFDRVSSTEEDDKLYSDELVRRAVEMIQNDKYKFAVKSKYFNKMSQDEMAELWEEETGLEESSGNWSVYTQRGRIEVKKNLTTIKNQENNDVSISEYVNNLLDL